MNEILQGLRGETWNCEECSHTWDDNHYTEWRGCPACEGEKVEKERDAE